jgi:hypothetical protein
MPSRNDPHLENGNIGHNLSVRFGNIILEAGFTVLPNILLRYQSALTITAPELNFICQIWYHWWTEKDAYPALATVAKRMGAKDVGTLRRISRSLQQKGYLLVRDRLSTAKGQLSSEYDFSALVDRLEQLYLEEKGSQGVGEVDWISTPREKMPGTPLAKMPGGGVAKMPGDPLAKTLPEEYEGEEDTVGNKTNREEDTINSNRFDFVANLQKPSNSKFSKTTRENATTPSHKQATQPTPVDNSLAEVPEQARPASAGHRGMTSIAHILSARANSTTASEIAPRSSKTTSKRSYNPSAATDGQVEVPTKRKRGRPPKYPLSPHLETLVRDITSEFHDSAKVAPNLSFVGRLQHESGFPDQTMSQLILEARQYTKQRGNIEKPAEGEAGEMGLKNRFPYFAQTLVDLINKEGRPVARRRDASNLQPGAT